MTEQTLNKANELKRQIDELESECERLPRKYIHDDDDRVYFKRHLVQIAQKFFVQFPKRHNRDMKTLLELSEEDLQALVDIRMNKITMLREELENLI